MSQQLRAAARKPPHPSPSPAPKSLSPAPSSSCPSALSLSLSPAPSAPLLCPVSPSATPPQPFSPAPKCSSPSVTPPGPSAPPTRHLHISLWSTLQPFALQLRPLSTSAPPLSSGYLPASARLLGLSHLSWRPSKSLTTSSGLNHAPSAPQLFRAPSAVRLPQHFPILPQPLSSSHPPPLLLSPSAPPLQFLWWTWVLLPQCHGPRYLSPTSISVPPLSESGGCLFQSSSSFCLSVCLSTLAPSSLTLQFLHSFRSAPIIQPQDPQASARRPPTQHFLSTLAGNSDV